MRRRLTLLLAMSLMVGVTAAAPAVADHDDDGDGGTYLSLGDSVAAGTQQPSPFTDNGYADKLFRRLSNRYGFDKLVNLACPGDDTVEMLNGIGGESQYGSACYGPFAILPPGGTSQLDVAVEYLATNPGEVKLITIAIGANDILACDPNDPDVATCVATQLGQIGATLSVILATLRAAAPGVPIVAMNYYNPNLAFWLVDPALAEAALALTEPFNGTLEAVYGAFDVPVADVESAFRTYKTHGKRVPANVRAICRFTLMCEKDGRYFVLSDYDPDVPGPQTDIHPSNKGYRKIARTFAHVIEDLELLDG
ncbi:MAG: SGNH/GDSL hydrolase family protein [bacterium]|nr:SGNH/GDSL hydrolase family protein [bacterium]